MNTIDTPADGESIRYNSITSLKAAHTQLLKNYKDSENGEALDEVEQFVRKAVGTGALLDSDNDRYGVQSLIDYWITILYRGKRNPPDAALVDFDPSLSPKLDNSLCPYRGLNAFQEADNAIFFGRQRLLDVLLKKVDTTNVLFVVGPSGSGKSSLVLAALIPALKNDRIPGSADWQYVPSFVPGSDPLKNLATSLGALYRQPHEWALQQVEEMKQDSKHLSKLVTSFSPEPAVVVIDQFEEVFTLCLNDSLRTAFIDNILNLATTPGANNQVVLTLRTDYETYLAQNPALMALFEDGQVRVMPLTVAELRSAIEEPAKHINLRFEEGVVDSLVKDILGEPEGLPLLQFTLLRLWKGRENGGNRITLNEYRKLGGARRALALTADDFYASLNEANRITLRRIMLRLALPSGTAEVLRNTVKREALYFEDPRRVNDVLDQLADAGLIRVTKADDRRDDKIEIAHEALVRHWPTLVGWIEKERVTMRQRLRLTSAAQQWLEHGKDADGLLGGSLLVEARQYDALNDLEKEFVAASQAAVDKAERQKEWERGLKQVRQRQFVSVLTVLLIVAIVAAVFGLWKASQARANERRATYQAQLAQRNSEEATNQRQIAEGERTKAEDQRKIAEGALASSEKAKALALIESKRARKAAARAIQEGIRANKYLALNQKLLNEKQRKFNQELELRNMRDEAGANIKRERIDAAITIYEELLERYKAANDLRKQAEMHSQLSRAYYLAAEKAEQKRDTSSAERNHQKSAAEYDSALGIIESESTKDIEAARGDKEKECSILWEKAQFFREHKKIAEAEKAYKAAIAAQEAVLTGNDLLREKNYDDIVDNLIDFYRHDLDQDKPEKLEALYMHFLEVKTKLRPITERPDEVYGRLREVAGLYAEQKRVFEVERIYLKALHIMEQLSKAEKTENEPAMLGFMVDTLTDLAKNYDEQKLPAEAEKYYRQALEKQRQRVSLEKKGDERVAEIETALAQTLKAQNKYSESLNSYGQAVKYTYGQKTEDPKPLIASLEAIAQILQEQKESEKIEESYKQALAACSDNEAVKNAIAVSLISQATYQYDHPAADETPSEAIKRFKVAEHLLSMAFSASTTALNTSNDNFQSALNWIIETKFAGGEGDMVTETESFLKELLDMKLKSSSDGDRRGLRSAEQVISALERLYRNRDESKLVTLYQNALTIRTSLSNGTINLSVYNAHNELGKLYLRLGKNDEAKANYKTALEIIERLSTVRKTTAGLVVDSLLNLANVHVTVKEFAEAEQFYLRAKTNLEANKRDKSLKMAEVLKAYASLLEKMGRLPEATKLQRDAVEIRNQQSTANQGPEKQ